MMKSEILGNLIGMSAEHVESDIDKGMWDILIELNQKGYYTIFCCEGHPYNHEKFGEDYWHGYLAFAKTYKFAEYPKNFFKVSHKRTFFYWKGNGEDNRQKFLNDLLMWARCLPTRPKEKVVTYHLIAKHKNQPNRTKVIAYTGDYEEIRCIMNRNDMDKYFDFELKEDIKYI